MLKNDTFAKIFRMQRTRKTTFFLLLCLFVFSQCSVTRNLGENQTLLVKHKISADSRKLDKSEMLNYVKPKPNRSFLGFNTRLYFYFAFKDSKRKLGSWLRDDVGEAPVLLNDAEVKKNEEQLRLFLNELGYYRATVSSEVSYFGRHDKKAVVHYRVKSSELFTIGSVQYQIADSSLAFVLKRAQNNSKVKEGKSFAISSLQDEQERLVRICNNFGYYAFSKDNVIFSADTTHGPDSVAVVIGIKKTTDASLKIHTVNKTSIEQGEKKQKNNRRQVDSTQIREEEAILHATYIKDATIQKANYISDRNTYSLFRTERTQKMLNSYPICKLVDIEFTPSLLQPSSDTVQLDCSIHITPEKKQSVNFEIEGTNTSGDWGAEFDMSYINRNVFHGAESMNLKLKLAEEYNNVLRDGENDRLGLFNSQEYGVELDFTTPKFLVPFNMKKYDKKFRAKTNCHIEYNYLQTPDYTRPTTEVNLGYIWYGRRFWTYNLNPIDVSYIRYYDISDRFSSFINSRNYYKYSYEDYLLYGNNFSLVFYNKRSVELHDYQYFKLYAETSGNLMYAYCKATKQEKNSNGQYETFSLPFAQYVKAEADFRYYDVVSSKMTFVYRIFGGITIPYLNSEGLPSVKKYYAGGANSMRAWECRSLGIGSYVDTANSFKYYLGDVKLEMNFETRFHLFWLVDGAFFIDAGNIWSFKDDELQGARFRIKDFYKDLAVGTGLGLRFDFSFLVLRCDVGMKVREPYTIADSKSHLIIGNRSLTRDDFNLNIGIGYPF